MRTTVDRRREPLSTANADTNNNYIINKDINNIDYININHINQSEDTDELSTYAGHSDRIDEIDRIDSQRQAYIELIRKNIEYDHGVNDIRTPLTLRTHTRRLLTKPLYSVAVYTPTEYNSKHPLPNRQVLT